MDCILNDETNASYHADEAIGSTTVKVVALHSLVHAFPGENKISKYAADEGTGTPLSSHGGRGDNDLRLREINRYSSSNW